MEKMLPHTFLAQLKGILNEQNLQLIEQKQLALSSQEFEMAKLYRDVEEKLLACIQTIGS